MQPVFRSQPSLEEVFEASPSGLLVCQAVRGEANKIIDFQACYVNSATAQLLSIPREAILSGTMLATQPDVRESGLFDRYVAVTEGGGSFDSEIFINNRWYSGSVVRLGDGFVITFVSMDEAKAALRREEQARTLLEGILNATPLAINHLEAVLDETGEPLDFVFRMVNPASEVIGKRPAPDLIGHRLTERYPNVLQTGVFDQYARVWKTGEPWRAELPYHGDGLTGWFSFTVTRHGNGLVTVINDISDRKRTELHYAELATQLQVILANTPVGVALMRAVRNETGELVDLEWTLVNDSTARTVLLPGENITGKRLLELFPSVRTVGAWDGFYKKTVDSGESQLLETYYEADGLKGWYRLESTPLGDGMLLTLTEITDRKEAELEVHRQAELLKSVVDNVQTGIGLMRAVRNAEGRIVDFRYELTNRGNAELTGLPVETMLGGLMTELMPGTVESGFLGWFAEIAETRQTRYIEFPYQADGIDGWFDMRAVPYEDGVLFSSMNVSAIRQAQLARQRQTELFDGIINTALSGIIHWLAVRDAEGEIVDLRAAVFNQAGCDMAGITSEQFRASTFLQLDPEGLFLRYVRVIESGEPLRAEYFFEKIDAWFDVTAAKLGDGVVVSFGNVTPLKRAEQTQARQAELFNQVLNTSLNGILLLQPVRNPAGQTRDFRVRLFNQAAHDLTGLSWEYTQARTLLQMNESIGTSGLLEAAARVLETGDSLRVEFFFEPADCWFDVSVARLDDELVVTFSDISSVRESVRERQRHAASLQALLDGSINAILAGEAVRDESGTLVDFHLVAGNRAVEVMLSRSLSEIVGQKLLTEYPGNVQSGSFQRYKDTVETGQPQRFEMHYQADGLDTWFDISTVKQGDGLIISFLDVSEAKRAQQALLGEATLFQTLSSRVPEAGALVVDTGQRVLFANGELPALFTNSDQTRLPGKRLADVLRTEFRPNVQAALRQALAGALQQESMQIGEAWYELVYSPVRNAEGAVVMAMATFRNVTRDRLYQQRLQATNENLERFAYVASHDLQEPLRKIQSFGDMLFRRQAGKLDESSLNLIHRMQAAATRMNELIRDLLTYSRFSVAQHDPFEPLALDRLIAEVRNDLEVVIREKGATLYTDALPSVMGDALQLRQLFQNLLSNALKFSQPGVPPRVELRYQRINGADAPLLSGLAPEGLFHEISVSDNGIGFDPQYTQRIFEAFQRLHGRGDYPGTGIGLAIVKKVVENHHGGLFVSSQPGEGSTFVVYLPVEETGRN